MTHYILWDVMDMYSGCRGNNDEPKGNTPPVLLSAAVAIVLLSFQAITVYNIRRSMTLDALPS